MVAIGSPGQPAADLDDLAGRNLGSTGSPASKSKTDRLRGHPLPGGLPGNDPRPRRPHQLRRESGQRRLQPAAGAGQRQRRTRCSAASATSRASTCANAASNRSITPVDQLGVPTYDELVLVANRETLEAEPEKFRLFLAALERGTDAAVAQPTPRPQAILAANHDAGTETDQSRGGSDAAAARRPRRGPALRLHGPRRLGRVRRLDARQRTDRLAAERRRSCSATTTCRARFPSSPSAPSASRRLISLSGIAAWKRVALGVVAAEAAQLGQLDLVLDALGDHLE